MGISPLATSRSAATSDCRVEVWTPVCCPLSIDRTTKKLGQKKPTKKTQNYNLDLSTQRGNATPSMISSAQDSVLIEDENNNAIIPASLPYLPRAKCLFGELLE